MKSQEHHEYLIRHGISLELVEHAYKKVLKFEKHLIEIGKNFDSANLEDLKNYLLYIIQ
ncbi:hypothetical protein JW865_02285 [Candidatus Bathyarchaeota archaeon]|nr:hypothetical protein [Candidatus Bathyarchaeota archaeon]